MTRKRGVIEAGSETKYNAWAVLCSNSETEEEWFAQRSEFASNKLGHDDEVDRVRAFKSREACDKARDYLRLKFKRSDVLSFHTRKVLMVAYLCGSRAKKALG